MERLPSELLLQLAARLPQSDLCSLSLVSKKLRPAAQEVLLYAPVVPQLKSAQGVNKLVRLLQYIIERPQLASYIKTLDVSPTYDSIIVPTSITLPEVPEELRDAFGNFHRNIRIVLSEYDLVALILMRASRLRELSITAFDPDRDGHPLGDIDLFVYARGLENKSSVPGLCHLRTLRLDADSCCWKLIHQLPSIMELHLSKSCRICRPPSNNAVYSNVQSLTLECEAIILYPLHRGTRYENLPPFLKGFRNLKQLSIILVNIRNALSEDEYIARINVGNATIPAPSRSLRSWVWLRMMLLVAVGKTIQHFKLRVNTNEDPTLLRLTTSIFKLSDFQNLRHLSLPYEAMRMNRQPYILCIMLPATIESLEILYADSSVLRALNDCSSWTSERLSNLRTIDIDLRIQDDDGFLAPGFMRRFQAQVERMQKQMGLTLRYTYDQTLIPTPTEGSLIGIKRKPTTAEDKSPGPADRAYGSSATKSSKIIKVAPKQTAKRVYIGRKPPRTLGKGTKEAWLVTQALIPFTSFCDSIVEEWTDPAFNAGVAQVADFLDSIGNPIGEARLVYPRMESQSFGAASQTPLQTIKQYFAYGQSLLSSGLRRLSAAKWAMGMILFVITVFALVAVALYVSVGDPRLYETL